MEAAKLGIHSEGREVQDLKPNQESKKAPKFTNSCSALLSLCCPCSILKLKMLQNAKADKVHVQKKINSKPRVSSFLPAALPGGVSSIRGFASPLSVQLAIRITTEFS
ncbi:hypothetical protein NMG60_11037531 [Bertholletia excelsa]